MASLVGFMFSNRQNVVADRDVQAPVRQMEDAHSHEGQSVVCGGKIVFLGKLAVATAEVVSAFQLLRIPILLFVKLPAGFQFFDQIFPERRILNTI